MELALNRASDVPLYRQVVEQLSALIRRGVLATGTRLPTIRALADETGLTRLTIQNAYLELGALGYIESHVGRGTFVAARLTIHTPNAASDAQPPISWTTQGVLADMLSDADARISFARAMPDPATYPVREIQSTLREALEDPALLGYGPVGGDLLLREAASRLLLERGVAAPPEAILITNGSMNGIDLTFRTLAQRGDVVFVEQPTYPGALEAAARQGLRVVGLPLDDEGVSMADLEALTLRHQPRFIYLVPTYQNPTGICYSAARKAQLLAFARAHTLPVIEDDTYGLLSFARSAPPALMAQDPDACIIYLSSFSKCFIPGLRLGVLTAPVAILADIARTKQHSDLNSSPLLQRALALYLRRGHFGTHLAAVRARYHERCEAMQTALAQHLPHCTWTEPEGGLTLWVSLPWGISEAEVVRAARNQGISVTRGQVFFPQAHTEGFLRLSYGAVTPDEIAEGVRTLGRIVADHLRARDALLDRARRESVPLV